MVVVIGDVDVSAPRHKNVGHVFIEIRNNRNDSVAGGAEEVSETIGDIEVVITIEVDPRHRLGKPGLGPAFIRTLVNWSEMLQPIRSAALPENPMILGDVQSVSTAHTSAGVAFTVATVVSRIEAESMKSVSRGVSVAIAHGNLKSPLSSPRKSIHRAATWRTQSATPHSPEIP